MNWRGRGAWHLRKRSWAGRVGISAAAAILVDSFRPNGPLTAKPASDEITSCMSKPPPSSAAGPEEERPPDIGAHPGHSLQKVLAANWIYASSFGDKTKLLGAPRRCIAILTCMDARIDPAKICGLEEGDAHVIRNAGGRASDDAIRSLVVSGKLMGTTDWYVIHHTACGMQTYSDEEFRRMVELPHEAPEHKTAKWAPVWKSARMTGSGAGLTGVKGVTTPPLMKSASEPHIDWLTFSNLEQSVIEDVRRVRNHPLVPASIAIFGYVYDVHSGRLEPVAEANKIGAPVTVE